MPPVANDTGHCQASHCPGAVGPKVVTVVVVPLLRPGDGTQVRGLSDPRAEPACTLE